MAATHTSKRKQCTNNRRQSKLKACEILCGYVRSVALEHFQFRLRRLRYPARGEGGGVLPYNRLQGMCCWMGSHFHDWTDYNGVAFLVELLEWDRTISGFLG